MTPGYLENQIERSRRNLRLDTIDLFYLHNPETQLSAVAPEEFARQHLLDAFVFLAEQQQVQAGAIRWYGAATWNMDFAFRRRRASTLPLENDAGRAGAASGRRGASTSASCNCRTISACRKRSPRRRRQSKSVLYRCSKPPQSLASP